MHCRVGVQRHLRQVHMSRFPDPLPQAALPLKQLLRYPEVQGRNKAPEGRLPGQLHHLQDAGQHRLPLQKTQMVEPGESRVAGQHHHQHKPIPRHGLGLPPEGERFLHQLLEAKLLQHDRHRQQAAVGGQIPGFEVIGRGSPDSIGFWRDFTNPLVGGLTAAILDFDCSPFGWLLRIGVAEQPLRTLLLYRGILRGPQWCQASAGQRQPRRRA